MQAWASVAVFVLAANTPGEGEIRRIQIKTILKSSGARMQLPSPMPSQIQLSTDRPAGVRKAPEGAALLWGTIAFGAGASPLQVTVAIDESTAASPVLYVDRNADGDLTNDARPKWTVVEGETPSTARAEGELDLPRTTDGAQTLRVIAYRYRAEAAKVRGLPANVLFYYRDYCISGAADVDGTRRSFLLCDEDSCGDFTFPHGRCRKLRYGIDLNNDGQVAFSTELQDAGTVMSVGNTQWKLSAVSADGGTVKLEGVPKGVKIASELIGKGIDDKPIEFPNQYRGKLVLVHFWATWCGYCKREMPNVVSVRQRFRAQNVEFLGVSLDQADAEEKVRSYMKQIGMDWAQLYDGKAWQSPAAREYGVRSIPSPFLIDADTMRIIAEGQDLRGEKLATTLMAKLAERKK